VTDIVGQRRVVGSNLTAVELSGLTNVKLGFPLALAVGVRRRRRPAARQRDRDLAVDHAREGADRRIRPAAQRTPGAMGIPRYGDRARRGRGRRGRL
jgi:hypothetical protein